MMAHVMGVPLPGIQPSPSYYPGYEWWPYNMPTIPEYGMSGEANYGGPEGPGGIHTNAPFTFDEGQYSSAFVQGVNSPNPDMYHYPPESHG